MTFLGHSVHMHAKLLCICLQNFSRHLIRASALPGETGNPEIASFYLNTLHAVLWTNTHISKTSWLQLNSCFAVLVIVCTRQDLHSQKGSMALCKMLHTPSAFAVSLAVSKNGVVFVKPGVKTNGQTTAGIFYGLNNFKYQLKWLLVPFPCWLQTSGLCVTARQAKSSKLLTGRDRRRSPRSTTCQ